MKKTTLLFAFLCLANSLTAATINLSSGGIAIKNKNGELLTSGAVRLGFFKNYTTATAGALAASLRDQTPFALRDYLASNFVPIAEPGANSLYGVQSAAGTNGLLGFKPNNPAVGEPAGSSTISGTIANSTWTGAAANSQDAAGIPRGTRLFLLVYNNPSTAAADGIGIYSSTAWVTSTNTLVTALNASLSAVDDGAGSGAATEFWVGSRGSLVLGNYNNVPEPTSFTLAGLAALGFIARRRRA